jgi:hypothetical protein
MHRHLKCEYCGGAIIKTRDKLKFKSKALGDVLVPDIEQSKCTKCNDVLISLDEADKVAKYIKDKEHQTIKLLPFDDMISLNAAAKILGITKQAFSKNSRIKRGFIYSAAKDNKKYYYRKSVEAFKLTGDGRIALKTNKEAVLYKYIKVFITKDSYKNTIESPLAHDNLYTNILPSHSTVYNRYARC